MICSRCRSTWLQQEGESDLVRIKINGLIVSELCRSVPDKLIMDIEALFELCWALTVRACLLVCLVL